MQLKKYSPRLRPYLYPLLLFLILAACCLLMGNQSRAARPAGPDSPAWRHIAPGLDLVQFDFAGQDEKQELPPRWQKHEGGKLADLVLLRIDPEKYEFTLHMASEAGKAKTLLDYARDNELTAAINAGMYLPDNLTSTGYLKNSTHTNNPRIASSFGAFFMAEPLKPGLPKAVLLERNELGDNLKEKLDDYAIVVQNYRLTNASGNVLWKDKGQAHSASALSRDARGNIIMIICRHPLTPSELARSLLSLNLGLNLIMYLEGGKEAGLILRPDSADSEGQQVWPGRNRSLMGASLGYVAIPNAIGLRQRHADGR